MFDRVESTDASFKKYWLLHSINEPSIDDKKITVINGQGNVTCQTIYPEKVEMVTIGGPGHEFEVNGTNFPSAKKDPEAGAWRVEISPEINGQRDYFLHVLRTAESSPVTPVVELLQSEDSLGVRIKDNGYTYEVHFTRNGELKSRIYITDSSGNTIVNDQIASLLPKILQHPKDVTVEPDSDARFFIKDEYAGSYKWQVNTGDGYIDISNNNMYSGAHTDTLSIKNAPLSMSKNKYRCVVSNSSDSFPSNEAVLTVIEKEKPVITSLHQDQILTADYSCRVFLPDYTVNVTATDNYTVNLMISQNPEPGSPVSGSENIVTLMATDESGNSAMVSFNVQVTDSIKPVIACTENQNMILTEGESAYQIKGTELDPVSITDNCEISNITNNYNHSQTLQFAEFPAGTTTVTWTVADAAGNQEQCTHDLTVSTYVGFENIAESGILIYPNPSKGKFYFGSSNHLIRQIKVSDLTGKICMVRNSPGQEGILDLSPFADGIYHLNITTSKKLFVFKVILAS